MVLSLMLVWDPVAEVVGEGAAVVGVAVVVEEQGDDDDSGVGSGGCAAERFREKARGTTRQAKAAPIRL